MKGLLKEFVEGVREKNLGVLGVVVRRHGEIIDSHDFVPSERIQLFSASKTWVAMGVGIAMGEGRFGITDCMTDLLKDELPEKLPDNYGRLTVWHLLTMSTGHAECPIFKMQRELREKEEAEGRLYVGGKDPADAGKRRGYSDMWFDAFMREPLSFDPDDRHFAYNNGATYILSRIVEKAVGMNLRDYLIPRLFTPLGIENPRWDSDSAGHTLGALGLHLTTEELSRGGQLLLNLGKWNGVQLIPEDYVREMTRKQVENAAPGGDPESCAGYGYQTWMCTRPGCYRMDGMLAQFSVGIPDYDMVVGITSHEPERGLDILRLIWDGILPKLTPGS